MRQRIRRIMSTGIAVAAALSFWGTVVTPASAIPAFARKYGLSCTTCHDPFPRLKDYGEEFAANGFSLPDKEEPPRAYRDTGDERLLLQRDLPIAFRFDGFYSVTPDEDVTNDFKYPWGLKILSGGSIAKNVGYYLYFYFSERGEIAGIEDAYIHFNNIGGTELDVFAGQFQISDPLFKRELRLTFEDYQFYTTRIGFSRANLAYDRGIMLTYSLPSRTDFAVEVLNGNGKGESSDKRNFDVDSDKTVFFRMLQSFPGVFSVGGFTYFGRERAPGGRNGFVYFGSDVSLGSTPVRANIQYIYRKDDNPLFRQVGIIKTETKSFIGEIVAMPKNFLYTVFLYNYIKSDQVFVPDYETVTFNVTYLHHSNLKMLTEYGYDWVRESSRFTVGVVAGF